MTSPIEEILAPRLEVVAEVLGWTIRRQVRFARYTVDFLVETFAASLIVECDGMKWHERSEEDALHDRQRDRFILSNFGISTVRFLGCEIIKTPQVVVTEIVQLTARLRDRQKAALLASHQDGYAAAVVP